MARKASRRKRSSRAGRVTVFCRVVNLRSPIFAPANTQSCAVRGSRPVTRRVSVARELVPASPARVTAWASRDEREDQRDLRRRATARKRCYSEVRIALSYSESSVAAEYDNDNRERNVTAEFTVTCFPRGRSAR